MKAVIRYALHNHKDRRDFRLVCTELTPTTQTIGVIEVCDRDALGAPSWRPCPNSPFAVEQVLARALFASQGVAHVAEGNNVRIEIDLGTVTL